MSASITPLLRGENSDNLQDTFYPTPIDLANRMLEGVKWQEIRTILEPSAGKGDLVAVIEANAQAHRYWYSHHKDIPDIDCIELDENLRHILKGKNLRVVHDDFLTFRSYCRYQLIVMNPPFSHGAEHLLKAIDMQKNGGVIRCLLNAETILNPYTEVRKELARQLAKYDADVEFIEGAFKDAERKTDVDIALVKIVIPYTRTESSLILDSLKPAHKYADAGGRYEETAITKSNFVDALVDRYQYEAEIGLRLIDEWWTMRPLLGESKYSSLIELKVGDRGDPVPDDYVRKVRRKYWSMLFERPEFMEQLTSELQGELRNRVNDLANYEFSAFNIYEILIQMTQKMNQSIEGTIIGLFDDWTRKYHWDENSQNRHYFNGWRTNDAFAVGKKVIIPFYSAFDSWSGKIDEWHCVSKMNDIEKVFNYLDGGASIGQDCTDAIKIAASAGITRNIRCKYFTVTFYKKGTCHIVFQNLDVLAKFNIFAAKNKNWLPPAYGKKRYKDMDAEEKAVIDSFQGEEAYEQVMSRADYFLETGTRQFAGMLMGGTE